MSNTSGEGGLPKDAVGVHEYHEQEEAKTQTMLDRQRPHQDNDNDEDDDVTFDQLPPQTPSPIMEQVTAKNGVPPAIVQDTSPPKITDQNKVMQLMLPGQTAISNQNDSNSSVWGGSLGLGGGGNPLQYEEGIFANPAAFFRRATLSPRKTCSETCFGEDGSCAFGVLRQFLMIIVGIGLGILGLILSADDTTQEWKSGDIGVDLIVLYIAALIGAYIVLSWVESIFFWILHRVCRPCGRYTRTFTFYASSFDGTLSKVTWIALGWAAYRPFFDIDPGQIWLDKLWASLLSISLVDGARIFLQRWILSNVLKSTYEEKVDELLKRVHVAKLLMTPFRLDQIRHRASHEDWASEIPEDMETTESLLLQKEASLAEKLNYIRATDFTLPDGRGEPVPIKRGRDLNPFVEAVFRRLTKLPHDIIREAGKTAKRAAMQVEEGSAIATTYVSASDAVFVDKPFEAEKPKGGSKGDAVVEFDQTGGSKEEDDEPLFSSNDSSSANESGGKSDGDQIPQTSSTVKPKSWVLNSLFGKSSIPTNAKKSQKGAMVAKTPKGTITRAHVFLVLGKLITPAAIARFDSNGDGTVKYDEFASELHDTLRRYKSLKETESCHQSVSKAIYYVVGAAALLLSLIIVLPLWDVALTEVFVPIGTLVIALSFAIGGTLQDLLSSLIFLTVVQPYDVAERISSPALLGGETLVVDKIDVLTTTFRRLNGKKFIIPNSFMARQLIENHKRSKPATFIVKLNLSYDTSAEKIDQLKQHMVEYLRTHSRQWRPELALLTDSASPGPDNMLTLSFWITHNLGWQNGLDIWSSYGSFVMHAVECLKALNISYQLPVNPVRLVQDGHPTTAGVDHAEIQRRTHDG